MSLNHIKFLQSLFPKHVVEQTTEFPIYELDMTGILDNQKILDLIISSPTNFSKKERCILLKNQGNNENEGSYDSEYNLFENEKWQFFVNEVTKVVTLIESKLSKNRQIKSIPQFFHLWYVWYNKDSSQVLHQHGWESKWAIVYYVQANKDDAPIIFQNKDEELVIQPMTGKLLIFPGKCWHKVAVQQANSKRIALVGNIGF